MINLGCNFQNDRDRFDASIRQFLTGRLKVHAISALSPPLGPPIDPDAVETTALADFFQDTPSPLSVLLRQTGLKDYLLRPISEVEFAGEAYEPVFSKFEQRIYNLASRDSTTRVPFRYSAFKHQDFKGDTISLADDEDDYEKYFGVRRADISTTNLMTDDLEADARNQSMSFPVRIANRHGDTITECLQSLKDRSQHDDQTYCYLIQRRHDLHNERRLHFGTLLAVIKGGADPTPSRVIFFDSMRRPNGKAYYEQDFKNAIDQVFPAASGQKPFSEMAEDGGLNLWRGSVKGTPKKHFDFDCSFYTFAMAKALIRISGESPDILLYADIDTIRSEMTARMPDYFHSPNMQKSPEDVRKSGLKFRWEIGRDHLKQMDAAAHNILPFPESLLPDLNRAGSSLQPEALTA